MKATFPWTLLLNIKMIVWSAGKIKKDVDKSRLVVERAKFVSHVMLSAGVCYGG